MKTATSTFFRCADCDKKRAAKEEESAHERDAELAAEARPAEPSVTIKAAGDHGGGKERALKACPKQAEGAKQPLKKRVGQPKASAAAAPPKAKAAAVPSGMQHQPFWLSQPPCVLQRPTMAPPAGFGVCGDATGGIAAGGVGGLPAAIAAGSVAGMPTAVMPTAVAVPMEEDSPAANAAMHTLNVSLLPTFHVAGAVQGKPPTAQVDGRAYGVAGWAGAGAGNAAGSSAGQAAECLTGNFSGNMTVAAALEMAELAALSAARMTWLAVRTPGMQDTLPPVLAAGCRAAAFVAFNTRNARQPACAQAASAPSTGSGHMHCVTAGGERSAPGSADVCAASRVEREESSARSFAPTQGLPLSSPNLPAGAGLATLPSAGLLAEGRSPAANGGRKVAEKEAAAAVSLSQPATEGLATGSDRGWREKVGATASLSQPVTKGRSNLDSDRGEKVTAATLSSSQRLTGGPAIGSGQDTHKTTAAVVSQQVTEVRGDLMSGGVDCVDKAAAALSLSQPATDWPRQGTREHSPAFATAGKNVLGSRRTSPDSGADASGGGNAAALAGLSAPSAFAGNPPPTEAQAGGYQLEGSEHVGQNLAKTFGRRTFLGTVVAWAAPAEEGEPALWRVVYHDGDEEDLEEAELCECLDAYRRAPSSLARHRPVLDARVAEWRRKQ